MLEPRAKVSESVSKEEKVSFLCSLESLESLEMLREASVASSVAWGTQSFMSSASSITSNSGVSLSTQRH